MGAVLAWRRTIAPLGGNKHGGGPKVVADMLNLTGGSVEKSVLDRLDSQDPEVAVILLDFILGYNASADPVGDLLDVCIEGKRIVSQRGGYLSIVASICGTDGDFQDLERQTQMLMEVGVVVLPAASQAAAYSRELALSLQGGE